MLLNRPGDTINFIIDIIQIPISPWKCLPVYFVDQKIKRELYQNITCCLSLEDALAFIQNQTKSQGGTHNDRKQ